MLFTMLKSNTSQLIIGRSLNRQEVHHTVDTGYQPCKKGILACIMTCLNDRLSISVENHFLESKKERETK